MQQEETEKTVGESSSTQAAHRSDSPGVCAGCGLPATSTCANCRTTRYCGRVCQRKAWPVHKGLCRSTRIAAEGGAVSLSGIDPLDFASQDTPLAQARVAMLRLLRGGDISKLMEYMASLPDDIRRVLDDDANSSDDDNDRSS